MSSPGSVTHWIGQLKAGDSAAAQRLWEGYFHRLVGLARAKLRGAPRRAADEEDVALSAFDSFCRGVERGRFPQLEDRDNLWKLLVTITARKALRLLRDQQRHKRGGLVPPDDRDPSAEGTDVEQVLGREPTPAFAAQVAEECRRLLESLGDPELERVALLKMEGHTTEEVAALLGRAPSTIERKLRIIRGRWAKEAEP
jgi:DNA-directed RNA polymerase specialized sigma24 family protein